MLSTFREGEAQAECQLEAILGHAQDEPSPLVPILWVVIPCYNEEQVLPITAPEFAAELKHLVDTGKISSKSKILFVDDGSKDDTWRIVCELSRAFPYVDGIALSRNRGHQNALLAGLMEARQFCDISISIDCDGQDDITVMEQMVDAYAAGNQIVYGVRSDRTTDSWLKRGTAQAFYKVMGRLGVESVYNHADYRLLSRRVLDELAEYQEVNLFLRGMVPLVGFSSTSVPYVRKKRIEGESHYPLGKMMALAVDGVTSLSIRPIRVIACVGFAVAFLSLIGAIWAVASALLGVTVSGWTSLMFAVFFMGGVQLFSLGVIGEYVGKTYLEAKHRPRFAVAKRTFED